MSVLLCNVLITLFFFIKTSIFAAFARADLLLILQVLNKPELLNAPVIISGGSVH